MSRKCPSGFPALSDGELHEIYHVTADLKEIIKELEQKVKTLEKKQEAMREYLGLFETAVIRAVENGDRKIFLKR